MRVTRVPHATPHHSLFCTLARSKDAIFSRFLAQGSIDDFGANTAATNRYLVTLPCQSGPRTHL